MPYGSAEQAAAAGCPEAEQAAEAAAAGCPEAAAAVPAGCPAAEQAVPAERALRLSGRCNGVRLKPGVDCRHSVLDGLSLGGVACVVSPYGILDGDVLDAAVHAIEGLNGLCLPALLCALDDAVLQQTLGLSLDGRSLSGVDAALFRLEADDATLVGVDLDVGSILAGSGGARRELSDVAVSGDFVDSKHMAFLLFSVPLSETDGLISASG